MLLASRYRTHHSASDEHKFHITLGHYVWWHCMKLNVFPGCMQLLRHWYTGQTCEKSVLLLLICLAIGSL